MPELTNFDRAARLLHKAAWGPRAETVTATLGRKEYTVPRIITLGDGSRAEFHHVEANVPVYVPCGTHEQNVRHLRDLLPSLSAKERVDLFDYLSEGYCRFCGDVEGQRSCQCTNDE